MTAVAEIEQFLDLDPLVRYSIAGPDTKLLKDENHHVDSKLKSRVFRANNEIKRGYYVYKLEPVYEIFDKSQVTQFSNYFMSLLYKMPQKSLK